MRQARERAQLGQAAPPPACRRVGVLCGGLYSLPLQDGAKSKRPELCASDVEQGRVAARHEVQGEAPGNLLFHRGRVVRQTPAPVSHISTPLHGFPSPHSAGAGGTHERVQELLQRFPSLVSPSSQNSAGMMSRSTYPSPHADGSHMVPPREQIRSPSTPQWVPSGVTPSKTQTPGEPTERRGY